MFWNSSASPKIPGTLPKVNNQGGFGLVELMVSIGIMVLVSSVIIVRQSSFDSAVLLRNQAYEIALQAREIQLGAVSAQSDGSGNFRSLLGLHFEKGTAVYKVFRDAGTQGGYDTDDTPFGIQGKFDSRFEIRDILIGGSSVSEVSVVFERPNFDAMFFDSGGTQLTDEAVQIVVGRAGSNTATSQRILEFTSTGQITVLPLP